MLTYSIHTSFTAIVHFFLTFESKRDAIRGEWWAAYINPLRILQLTAVPVFSFSRFGHQFDISSTYLLHRKRYP